LARGFTCHGPKKFSVLSHWLHWTDGEMNRCNGTAAYERDGELAVKSHATPLACQASLIAELRFVRFNHSAC